LHFKEKYESRTTIGFIGDSEVLIKNNDEYDEPSFHIINFKNGKHLCISLLENKCLLRHGDIDKKGLKNFLNENREETGLSNWQYMLYAWNQVNAKKIDLNIKTPDYSKLYIYKDITDIKDVCIYEYDYKNDYYTIGCLYKNNKYKMLRYSGQECKFEFLDYVTIYTIDDKSLILAAIQKYQDDINYGINNYHVVDYSDYNFILYYRYDSGCYDMVLKTDEIIRVINPIYCGRGIYQAIIHSISKFISGESIKQIENNKDIMKDPLYLSVLKNNDRLLLLKIKDHYGLLNSDEIKELSSILNFNYLPKLDERFDKPYYVYRSEVDTSTFLWSEYRFLHRPYFAMRGSTHDILTINPHTKVIIDAAPEDIQTIRYEEFIKLYELK